MLIALLLSFAWALYWLYQDATWTTKGIQAGIAVEGNTLITRIAGTCKPALWQLLLIDGSLRIALLGVGFIPSDTPAFEAAAIGMLLVAGIKNIQGSREWKWMFNHPGQTIPEANTVWQKLLGFWG